jgi:hypothetical protein
MTGMNTLFSTFSVYLLNVCILPIILKTSFLLLVLNLYKKMKNEGMTAEEIIEISRAYRRLPFLEDLLRDLKLEVQESHDLKEQCFREYIIVNERNMELERKNRELQNSNECYLKAINEKKKEITILDRRSKDHKGLDNGDKNERLLTEQRKLHELPFLNMNSIHRTFSDNNSIAATTKKSGSDPASEVITRKETVNDDKRSSAEKVIGKVFPYGKNEEKNVQAEPDKKNSISTERIDPG